MGFTRISFSNIRHNTWIVRSAYTADDDQLAGAMLQVGRAHPRKLRRPLPECDMVLSGAPILIENPLSDPRLHSELVANPKAYVAAPVYAWQTPVGLLHADAPTKSGDVDIAQRDLLGLFAEGVGAIFERNLTLGRLRRLRSAVEEHTPRIGSLAYEFEDELWENMDVEADTDQAGITVTGQSSWRSAARQDGCNDDGIFKAKLRGELSMMNHDCRDLPPCPANACQLMRASAAQRLHAQAQPVISIARSAVSGVDNRLGWSAAWVRTVSRSLPRRPRCTPARATARRATCDEPRD
jgi:hypothetical protein